MKKIRTIVATIVATTVLLSTQTMNVKANEASTWRIGIIQNGWGKTRNSNESWLDQCDWAKDIVVSGNRIGVIKKDGTACVREGGGRWYDVAKNVDKLALSGDTVGVIEGTKAYTKTGALDASWTMQSDYAKDIVLSGNRIGLIKVNGGAVVREGGNRWYDVANNVQKLALSGNTVGVIEGTKAYTKTGALDASWTEQSDYAKDIVLSGNRIGLIKVNGGAVVREGGSRWYDVANNVKQMALTQNEVVVLEGSTVYLKSGQLDASWSKQCDGVDKISITSLVNDRQAKVNKLIAEAKKHLGKRYVSGATGPDTFDCSGLTQYVYRHALGMEIGRTTWDQAKNGKTITSLKDLQPGDLVFCRDSENRWDGHVGIYVGNGQMIAAQNPSKGVIYASAGYQFCEGKRLF